MMKSESTEILFTDDMRITINPERFLTNGNNRDRFIQGLTGPIEIAGIQVKTCGSRCRYVDCANGN